MRLIKSSQNLTKQKIAYFSMEIALSEKIHTYSGGLGVLAGDTVRASADLKLPIVAVTLLSKQGYFSQELTPEGVQVEHSDPWNPSEFLISLPTQIKVQIQNRDVSVKAWQYTQQSQTGGNVPVYFLDTDIEGNTYEDRQLTSFLYGGDEKYRLKQEIVLGIGGVRMLEALGVSVRKYHMNEGHSSFLALELLRSFEMDVDKVRRLCVFTTHTPVEAGHDKFPYDLVGSVLGEVVPADALRNLAGQDLLNMTRLALNLSNFINGVAKRHRDLSIQMFPGYEIHAVTNGIHSYTWTSESFKRLFNRYVPGWANEPELLVRVDVIPDEEVWQAHLVAKEALLDHIKKTNNIDLEKDVLTLGFARRAIEYKRVDLVFSNLAKLRRINSQGKLQFVLAGKAHPKDEVGKQLIKRVFEQVERLKEEIRIVFLENYNIDLAAKLVSGVDVWLNTPLPPQEASGTSGMKAAHNGVINFSVLDGWWIEGWIEGVTGWSIGPRPEESLSFEKRKIMEVDDLYSKLENLIVPMYYGGRSEWMKMMKNSIGKIAYYFNSHRMMRRYVSEAYL